ncbi:Uncharacterised protein [Mycobacterium tuberculosis]|nr:Uncharacterised protein [Mycobacterium tuberculosis]
MAVTVENKPGEGGRLAAKEVRRTPAGQNVLMLGNPAVMVVAPLVIRRIRKRPCSACPRPAACRTSSA